MSDELAARLRFALARLHRRLRVHDRDDLTPSQMLALGTLDQRGPLRMGDLAAVERVAAATMTRIVAPLVERGLVTRQPDPEDGRCWLVALTPSAEGLLAEIRAARTAYLAECLAALPEQDRDLLAAALPALERLAEADHPAALPV
ncbi:MAG: MarR family winged helix-turn-helix transcriptional regulator [Mycobacteriales bacterium]|jgi:DNA-binding MarR family transcriptional regulator